ncbi:MAG: glycosyltransferase family 4 protein [Candidatus Latescibacteria bacterium]|nr:glycosyltransferase family 4 protein [Candidatus Latescibacterota bacterium]
MSRPRVLHVITRLDRGGSAENTLLCAAHMTGYDTVVAVGPTQGERSPTEALARQRGVEFVEVPHLVRPIRPLADLRALWELWRLMRRGRFDLVHTHTSKAGLLGRVAAVLARVPRRVHTAHGHVFYGYHGPALSRLFVWLERWAAWFTDRLVALTPAEEHDQLRFGVGSAAKFAVIHSGVDFAPFARPAADREVTRRVLGLALDGLVIGTLGRLTPIKGQADLVRAFAQVRPQVPEAWLLLVGDGEEGPGLAALVRELGVADRVVFAGWREEVPDLLRAMDIFVLPSLNEGMGKALVEAMYVGLPVVASRVGGVPDLIEAGRAGLLVPPGQPAALAAALLGLAADPHRRRELGARAAQVARAYSVESMIEKLDGLYQSLLKEST